ncbi:TonB-dependent receptor plug domain-containing protein [Bowmanella pacifica]|uniref:TonB-dependent receptor n=1 Tax=Bowmanella pacifica TaxID=502051 RepID=A0A918DIZ3_9ALTE|nr:TonB-dependent receptor [Bowmanella pacifica]GGO68777.1 hypothetical protein GCM10010982_18480 [Bowmanella pacifica]
MRGVGPTAVLLIMISSLICKDAFAQDVEALFNLTFDELLEQQVSISSRDAVSLDASPSTVTLFTRQMLDRLAVANLYDLLNYVPGFQVTRGDWVGAVPKEHARGVYLDNGYVLFMVDGQRVNEISFGKASVYMPFIPLSIAERVEVIRGPGSALYGSNAFMGVVNLITRKEGNMLMPRLGSRGSRGLSLAYFTDWQGLDWQFLLDVDHQGAASHQFYQSLVRDPRDNVFAQLGVQSEAWHLTGRYARAKMNGYINLGGASADNRYQSENIGIEGGLKWWQGEQGTLTSTLDISEHRISSAGLLLTAEQAGLSDDFFNGPHWITRNVQFSTDWVKPISQILELSAGLVWLDAEQTQAGAMTSHLVDGVFLLDDRAYLGGIQRVEQIDEFAALLASQDARSAYVQFKWQAARDWQVYLGGRVDKVERLSTNWSPRLALIHDVNAAHSIRLQYGEAFRTPTINELFSSDAVTQGNPELQQEKIATFEVLWRWQGERAQLETVLFQNNMRDFVNKVETQQDSRFTFANISKHSIQGVESTLNTKFGSHWETQIAYTALFDQPFNASFKRYGNFRLGYQDEVFSLNWDLLWRGEVAQGEFSQSAYVLLNLLGRWQWREHQAWTLSVSNLLDKTYQVYEPRLAQAAMPGERRQLMLGFQWIF